MKIIALIGSLILIIGACFGVYFTLQKQLTPIYVHEALAEEVKQNKKEVDYNFKSLQIEKATERAWQLEKRLEQNPKDETAQERLKELNKLIERYEKELKALGKAKQEKI